MNKQITNTAEADAIKASRAALKGVNSHVAKILAHNDDATKCMNNTARQLRNIADGMGDILIKVYNTNSGGYETLTAKKAIHALAIDLQETSAS